MPIVPPCAATVNPANLAVPGAIATAFRPFASPLPIPAEVGPTLDGRLASLVEAEEYRPSWRWFAPTPLLECEWLGYVLGADGVAAELESPDAAEQAAFDIGHNSGDDHLWTVDPLFAAHLKEQADRFIADATLPTA